MGYVTQIICSVGLVSVSLQVSKLGNVKQKINKGLEMIQMN